MLSLLLGHGLLGELRKAVGLLLPNLFQLLHLVWHFRSQVLLFSAIVRKS